MSPHHARAWDFVNVRKKIHASHARRARGSLTVHPPWIQIRDVSAARSRSCDRKSKFGLRHAIKLNQLYCMTKSEFWFSMIPPSTSGGNIRSFVLLLKLDSTKFIIEFLHEDIRTCANFKRSRYLNRLNLVLNYLVSGYVTVTHEYFL